MRRKTLAQPPVMEARHLEVTAKRLASSLVFGMEDSIFHGPGIEYAQPRLYVPGDPIKFMDWKVTARTGKLYMKEFKEPKRMPVYVLLDTSASMCVSSVKRSKYEWGLSLATGISLAAQSQMSPSGLLGCGEREIHIRPTLSPGMIMEWAHQLRTYDFLEQTSLADRVRTLGPSLKTRTLIVAITDLHDKDAVHALRSLAQDNDVMVMHLQDPAEAGIKASGFFRGREAETGRAFVGHGKQSWDVSEEMRHELTRARVDYVLLRTDTNIVSQVQFFLRTRGNLGTAR